MSASNFNRKFILGITLVSAMRGLLFGYDWVVIDGAKPFYERFFDIANSPHLQGWAMSSALICLAGFLFILRKLPESKRKSLEEIEKN